MLKAFSGGTFSRDFTASIVVFLVAMPLCMGIAVASGVPPEKGLITGMIGGLIVTETVFNIPGVARFLVEAIRWRDYPIVQNLVMFIAIIVVFVNFLIDMMYAVLDPRIKYEE